MLQITRDDLQPILAVHPGTQALRSAVEGAGPPPHLLSVIARYIQFNSAFGPGLANLAGLRPGEVEREGSLVAGLQHPREIVRTVGIARQIRQGARKELLLLSRYRSSLSLITYEVFANMRVDHIRSARDCCPILDSF